MQKPLSGNFYDSTQENNVFGNGDVGHNSANRTMPGGSGTLNLLRPDAIPNLADIRVRHSFNTADKVENYLKHLEDDISSSTSISCPLPNITNDPYRSYNSILNVPRATSYQNKLYNTKQHEADEQQYDSSADDTRCEETTFSKDKLFSKSDLDAIKLEIMSSVLAELRDTARGMTRDLIQPTNSVGSIPELNSDLYQTHLYTQL